MPAHHTVFSLVRKKTIDLCICSLWSLFHCVMFLWIVMTFMLKKIVKVHVKWSKFAIKMHQFTLISRWRVIPYINAREYNLHRNLGTRTPYNAHSMSATNFKNAFFILNVKFTAFSMLVYFFDFPCPQPCCLINLHHKFIYELNLLSLADQ